MVGLNYRNTCQKGNTTGNKRSWLFQRFINDNFLTPSWWKRRWEKTLFWTSFLQARKKCSGMRGLEEALAAVTMKLWGWGFLRERRRTMAGSQSNRLWPIQGTPWQNSMGYCPGMKRPKRAGWFSVSSSPKNCPFKYAEKSSKGDRRPAWMIKELLNKFRHKNTARADDPGGI